MKLTCKIAILMKFYYELSLIKKLTDINRCLTDPAYRFLTDV